MAKGQKGASGVTLDSAVVVDGQLYFIALWDSTRELLRSDGTAAGTTTLRTLTSRRGSQMVAVDNGFFFAVQTELWRSDGTVAGTSRVVQTTGSIRELEATRDLVYADSYSSGHRELWQVAAAHFQVGVAGTARGQPRDPRRVSLLERTGDCDGEAQARCPGARSGRGSQQRDDHQ